MAFSISHDIKQTGCNPKSCDQAYPYARMEGFTTPRDKLYGRTPLWEASSFGHISVIRSRMKERQMSLWRSPIIGLFQRVKKRPTYVPTHLPVCGVSGYATEAGETRHPATRPMCGAEMIAEFLGTVDLGTVTGESLMPSLTSATTGSEASPTTWSSRLRTTCISTCCVCHEGIQCQAQVM